MMHSKLLRLIDSQNQIDNATYEQLSDNSFALFDSCNSGIHRSQKADVIRHMPGLDCLLQHLERLCKIMFARFAETQRRNVRFGEPICLGPGSPCSMDSRMIVQV